MKILHDWDDSDAANILSAVADAGRPGRASVLIIETVLPEGAEPHWSKVLDVMMLALTGGRERTLSDYEGLLVSTGMELVSQIPTATPFSIIEGRVR